MANGKIVIYLIFFGPVGYQLISQGQPGLLLPGVVALLALVTICYLIKRRDAMWADGRGNSGAATANLFLRTIIWLVLFFLLRQEEEALRAMPGAISFMAGIAWSVPVVIFLEWADEGDRRRGVIRVPVGDYGYRQQILQRMYDQRRMGR